MYNILHNSKSGMNATQSKINVISNNIVNVNSSGYKKLEVEFQELLMESLYKDSYPNNSKKSQTGTGVKISNEFRNFAQGSLRETNISTNVAIDGEGFFRIISKDGSYAYTRNSEFSIDSNGMLVDNIGNILEINFVNGKDYNNTKFSNENISINKSGDIFLDNDLVGKINIYTSIDDNYFLSIGESMYIPKNYTNIAINNNINLHQGYIETSNVDLGQEIVDLISMQRAFQFNSKGITVADDMWSMVNNLQSR